MAAVQCIKSCGYGSGASVNVHIYHQNGEKCDPSEFDHGIVVVSARQGGLSRLSQKRLISWDFYAQQSLEFADNGATNKKHPLSSSSVGRKALLMREVS